MKLLILFPLCFLSMCTMQSQNTNINHELIKEDLNQLLYDLENYYVYLDEKQVDFDCIKEYYTSQVTQIKTEEETVLFFEYLLDEFYDSHVILNTNRRPSFRLYAPIYASYKNGKWIITSVWQTQIEKLKTNIIGAEVLEFNDTPINQKIKAFPTQCQDKTIPEVREWIVNKIMAGRYNEPRRVKLKLRDGSMFELDLDKMNFKQNNDLLSIDTKDNIAIIRINNALGRDEIVKAFDKTLDQLLDTEGLIIDLRNTVDGGDSYEARGIMSRFISTPLPYQVHQYDELAYGDPKNNPKIARRWAEYVVPRGQTYDRPIVVLVGRWTGSMGEGLAIGLEGLGRAIIVGTEMERLAGEMSGISFKNQSFGYRISTAKLFHVNGTPREKYVPANYIQGTTNLKDETLQAGLALIKSKTK